MELATAAEIITAIVSSIGVLIALLGILSKNFTSLRAMMDDNHKEILTKLTDIQTSLAEHTVRLKSLEEVVHDHGERIIRLEKTTYRHIGEDSDA